jgi:dolichol-phosphate mannosyltransferase
MEKMKKMNKCLTSLTVVCPVYNEGEVIEKFYSVLFDVLNRIPNKYTWKILFVVDRSTDNSLELLKDISSKESRVQILALSTRFGHQMVLVAGIDHSDSDVVIMLDSDLQHPPELIFKLLDEYESGHDVVYTIRTESKDNNVLARFASRSFYRVLNWLSDVQLSSGEADYRLITRRVADVFKHQIRERNQFLRGLFCWVGYKRVGVEYEAAEREYGVSKYTWSMMVNLASSGIISFSKKPLQYAIILGVIFSLLGLISAVVSVVSYFVEAHIPSGWATLSTLISLFGGIQLFFLGIIGEYIGAIFDEVKARPLYLVDERINLD